jgi:hypothetical protein
MIRVQYTVSMSFILGVAPNFRSIPNNKSQDARLRKYYLVTNTNYTVKLVLVLILSW